MVGSRARGVVILATMLAGLGGWAPVSSVAAPSCASTQLAAGRWSAVDSPPTPSVATLSPTAILATTVVGQDSSVILATDGLAVFRSTDAGCHWKTTYTLGATDYYSDGGFFDGYAITNIGTGHSRAPANRQDVYLALTATPLNVFALVTLFGMAPPELFMVSHDGGQTFALIQPAPTANNPIVPECESSPYNVLVSSADPRTVYLQCSGGLVQDQLDRELASSGAFAYRSRDGGRTWVLMGLPLTGTGLVPLVPGAKANELWLDGYSSSLNGGQQFVEVWHSADGGRNWTVSKPSGKPGVGLGGVSLAVDMAATAGGRAVVTAQIGVFLTTDGGKHWSKLHGLENSTMRPTLAFFVRHNVYVVATPPKYCQAGAVVLRYPDPRKQPVTAPFPSRWGTLAGWGTSGSVATADGSATVFGLANFCEPNGTTAAPPKLLSFRAK